MPCWESCFRMRGRKMRSLYGICYRGRAKRIALPFTIGSPCWRRRRQTSRAKAFCDSTRKCWIPGGIRWATGTCTSGTCTNALGPRSNSERLTHCEIEASWLCEVRITRRKKETRQDDAQEDSSIPLFMLRCDFEGDFAFRRQRAGGAAAHLSCI